MTILDVRRFFHRHRRRLILHRLRPFALLLRPIDDLFRRRSRQSVTVVRSKGKGRGRGGGWRGCRVERGIEANRGREERGDATFLRSEGDERHHVGPGRSRKRLYLKAVDDLTTFVQGLQHRFTTRHRTASDFVRMTSSFTLLRSFLYSTIERGRPLRLVRRFERHRRDD